MQQLTAPPRWCGSASSPGAPASARRRFAPGSVATDLISPARSDGGFRLYSPADEQRIQAMRDLIAEGVAPAEAARQSAIAPAAPRRRPRATRSPDAEAERLRAALEAYDEEAANAVLDRSLSALLARRRSPARWCCPRWRTIGRRWARGEVSVAQEHFATSPGPRPPAGPGPRLGIGLRPAGAAGLPARRAARHRADRLRPVAAQPGLADRLSGPGHAPRHARRRGAPPGSRDRRPERHRSRSRGRGPGRPARGGLV